jgi:hypothetical protein
MIEYCRGLHFPGCQASDGSIYYVAVNSMTVGRPRMSEVLKALEGKISQDAPVRGEV